MTEDPEISVIVPFRNGLEFVDRCLQALDTQNYGAEQYEILCVDNGSDDATPERVRQHPSVQYLHCNEPGPYPARNMGIRHARGRLIAFTDIDCVPAVDWLRSIHNEFEDPGVGIVLGEVTFPRAGKLLHALERYENTKAAWVCNQTVKGHYFGYTNNMAIRRGLLSEVGFFESMQRGGDTVMVQRVIERKDTDQVRYSASVRVSHIEIKGVLDWAKKRFVYGRSSVGYGKITHSRPLSQKDRWQIFRETARRFGYGAGMQLAILALLVVGLFCFLAGRLIAHTSQSKPVTST